MLNPFATAMDATEVAHDIDAAFSDKTENVKILDKQRTFMASLITSNAIKKLTCLQTVVATQAQIATCSASQELADMLQSSAACIIAKQNNNLTEQALTCYACAMVNNTQYGSVSISATCTFNGQPYTDFQSSFQQDLVQSVGDNTKDTKQAIDTILADPTKASKFGNLVQVVKSSLTETLMSTAFAGAATRQLQSSAGTGGVQLGLSQQAILNIMANVILQDSSANQAISNLNANIAENMPSTNASSNTLFGSVDTTIALYVVAGIVALFVLYQIFKRPSAPNTSFYPPSYY